MNHKLNNSLERLRMDGIKRSRPAVTPATTTPTTAKPAAAAPVIADKAAPQGWGPKPPTARQVVATAPAPSHVPVFNGGLHTTVAPAEVARMKPSDVPAYKNIDEAFNALPASSAAPGQVRRQTDNVMAWNMKWDLVNKAQKTFDFSYFSIERDAYGLAYMGALLDARMRGVEVNGITDYMANSRGHGYVSTGLGADYMQELAAYGAKIGIYNAPGTRTQSVMNDGLSYKAVSSDHDKLCVADAGTPHAEGETGGRNVAGAYHQDPADNPKSWRDDSIQIKGRATDGLALALRRELDGPAVKMVKPDVFNMQPRATEMLGAYSMMNTWLKQPALSDAEKAAIRADPTKRKALADKLFEEGIANLRALPEAPDKVKKKPLSDAEEKSLRKCAEELANDLELRGSKAKYDTQGGFLDADVKILDQVGAASAPVGQRYNEMAPGMLGLIKSAQKEIVIENPYVVLTEDMMKEFEAASKRGVNITIVTNSPESTDSAVTQGFFLNDWKKFEERVPTARVFVATGERKFHAKAFVLDGKVSGDTSYNADLLSGMINGEVGAITRSEAKAQELLSRIHDDLTDPRNKFREWTIKRDASGNVVKDAEGQPVALNGPEQDVSLKLQRRYKPVQFLCDLIASTDLGAPLRHPK
jgi:phosphatidylserine/phosphatidylglycerophosphate/cardiolipin synthase-like enzyme